MAEGFDYLFFVEVLVDYTHARLTWSSTLKATSWVTLLVGVTNLMLLPLVV